MRTLLLTRGAPGCGKSTWIKNNHLENYTLSPDNLRLLCSTPSLQADGSIKISQERENEQMTWDVLFKILEYRMSRGEFTVVDATASKTKDIQKYKDLAQSYRYRMFIVDFTDVPLETCLKQNKMRDELKQVPQKAIENIYARFSTQKVPSSVKVIKPDEFNTLLEQPIDLSNYKKLVFIGDIHGCYDTLMQYPDFKNGLDPEVNYIFLGDYVDRGNQNAEVLKYLDTIKDLPNVCLLEGNHERWIDCFGSNVPSKSQEFELHTKPELYQKGYEEKSARMFYRKVRQFSHINYKGLEILACHGGIPNLNTNLLYLPTDDFIHGVGSYGDYITIAESWTGQTKDNQYLIHGHRNVEMSETQIADRVFNLEGQVEFGGKLRIVELDSSLNWKVIELENIQPITENSNTEQHKIDNLHDAIQYLRNNKYVEEKHLTGNISSFNFNKVAFNKGIWNRQTVLARGLFIDTENETIVARSYEKFFRINERRETELGALKQRFVFPVTAYVKENGFLAIISLNPTNNELFVASKSTTGGDFVGYINKAIEPYRGKLTTLLRDKLKGYSLVCECIDIENDPHIIKYLESKIVFLDAVKNDLEYSTLPYEELVTLSSYLSMPVKEKAYVFKDWDSFRSFYDIIQEEDYKYNDNYVEGFVFVDKNGFMTKCKTGYYNEWKKLRGVAQTTLRCGYITKTGMLTNALENLFYGYCKGLHDKDYNRDTKEYPYKTDIISLRERFTTTNGN